MLRPIEQLFDQSTAALSRFGRPIRDGLIVAGLVRAWYYFFVQGIQPWTFIGIDARAYWRVDLAHPYVGIALGDYSAYLYSPAFAQLTAPLSWFPFPVFDALWMGILFIVFAWLVRPWPLAGVILVLPVSYELLAGNVHFLLAAAIVLGFRTPGAWAFPILTKVTPGLGLLWFAVRREWRALTLAVGTTATAIAISYAIAPSAWLDWIVFLQSSPSRSEALVARTMVAAVLIGFGASTGRRWLVPVGVFLALPIPYVNSWVILLATIRLREPIPGSIADRPPLNAAAAAGG